jgi:tetratricopeptide (TPR) repeat protein
MFGFLKKEKKEKKQTPKEQTPSLLEVGAKVFNYNPEYIRLNEQIIVETVGQGRIYEDQQRYEEAIQEYMEAERLTQVICASEIAELKREFPNRPDDWDWLYLKMIRRRIRVCKKAIKKRDG